MNQVLERTMTYINMGGVNIIGMIIFIFMVFARLVFGSLQHDTIIVDWKERAKRETTHSEFLKQFIAMILSSAISVRLQIQEQTKQ